MPGSLFTPHISYAIKITKKTTKFIQSLKKSDKSAHDEIVKIIDGLKRNPRPDGVKKLNYADHAYRLKYKSYRIIYDVNDGILTIIVCLVGDRKEVYKELRRLDIKRIRKQMS